MSCVVRWWDVLFVKGMHFSSKNARLLNCKNCENSPLIWETNKDIFYKVQLPFSTTDATFSTTDYFLIEYGKCPNFRILP